MMADDLLDDEYRRDQINGKVLDGDYTRETRLLLRAQIISPGNAVRSAAALNDVVMQRRETGRMVDFETRIAGRYDLMNRLMTAGQDIRWRKQVIQLAQLTNDSSLLDIGTGTGDLAREALEALADARLDLVQLALLREDLEQLLTADHDRGRQRHRRQGGRQQEA